MFTNNMSTCIFCLQCTSQRLIFRLLLIYIYIWSQNLNSSNKRANNNKGNKPRAAHRETGLRSQNIKYGINISTEIFVCKTKAIRLHFH